ncbi:MAG TPA: transcriptional regulator NrdR [Phycisphaerae bacterium]|nr:transcriptional regulator NrdR [Phycisphaerae bacterium]HNU45677.1 transcriptional regulator NrdR [Phycisphaerae bacterium]
MRCPACRETNNNKVIDSRLTEGGAAIRRRRVCEACGRRFTTKERVEEELRLTVIKRSGQRVAYNRDKILHGVERACYKLAVADEQMAELVDRVEEELFRNHDREVTTEQIGKYVAQQLRHLHQVAYVRFMSVYRKFANVEEFVDEIREVRMREAHESPDQRDLFEA